MWWAICGFGLLTAWFYLWGEALFADSADDRAMRQYEREREEFERFFE